MKIRPVTLFLVTLILTATLMLANEYSTQSPILLSNEYESFQQRQNGFLSALSAQNIEKTMDFFNEDAVIHIANMPPVKGHREIRQLYENVFRFLKTSDYTPELIRISEDSQMGYGIGKVINIFEGEHGEIEYPGKYLLVWEFQDNTWLIVAYSISNNQSNIN